MDKIAMKNDIEKQLKIKYGVGIEEATGGEIFSALSTSLMGLVVDNWKDTKEVYSTGKQAYYLSAEYLMGRALGNNLISLGIYEEVEELLKELGVDINAIEESEEDAALGNGGLGRLAACFIDSAAAMEVPLQGYGIRYSNGLFKQKFENGFQYEEADSWLTYGDPWSIRREREIVEVEFADMKVKAVPYDTPIIGYKSNNINTLRLWKCEAIEEFDFNLFNEGKYTKSIKLKNKADDVSRVLYPNDDMRAGKLLRLKQQYFLVSASIQDIISKHVSLHGEEFKEFAKLHAVQLNDTHPVLAIPEFVRILVDKYNVEIDEAIEIAKNVFAYTNHTILAEALEKWDRSLIVKICPRIFEIIKVIDEKFIAELKVKGYSKIEIDEFRIINKGVVRMANLAIYIGFAVNGVAQLHTDILKDTELNNWYKLYPSKFQNKTNGITQRRWLRSCNKELSALITELLGNEDWVKNLALLKDLEKFKDDEAVLTRFMDIKHEKKVQLAKYLKEVDGIEVDPSSLFDIQVKRLHEYKRQLLNTLYILDLYYRIKENPEMKIPKSTFIYGAKAFPGYKRAKGIIKFTNDIANLINNDKDIDGKIKVVFVENYRVSYAEKLFPAADVSKQISTAGKEASGTGNMKFMLNGTPTVGTYDGANVEIVRESGEDNNFIFGLRIEDIEKIKSEYNSKEYYEKDPSLKRVIDTLIDGTFDDEGMGYYKDLYNSLVNENDQYYLLADFESMKKAEDQVFEAYADKMRWAKICFENTCNAGIFSSDRTILEYCSDIWNIKSTRNN
ncbi:glycogen/starch/alpha-glucan phosphorylase [Clostridium gasigenes]|uniref:glycogen/starch/alpha-glucan phosphorylase n=1 Tax=Clostridium gasigenes TaxID=94869 RepID=UPI001C0ABE03|nr:glycogen/starch/alpha-glucan phosphorylase [Clostridium gasigenes]MBU3103265.1 glycogen/starch/alpha-glucan phosphorylase [Clostridium gasigenes]MBU3108785.1 glycogen/starch/alpha-glucan phosphorylase [Clostridium gasigenes]